MTLGRGGYVFDSFISSVHLGMRKPDRTIYDYTMKQLREKWPHDDIHLGDIVFFDDIGENLKCANKLAGGQWRCDLGKRMMQVKELEKMTGEVFK